MKWQVAPGFLSALSGIGGKENLLPPENVDGYGKLSRLMAAMTVMECGIALKEADMDAICKGYRFAFPENSGALDEWLVGEDECGNW